MVYNINSNRCLPGREAKLSAERERGSQRVDLWFPRVCKASKSKIFLGLVEPDAAGQPATPATGGTGSVIWRTGDLGDLPGDSGRNEEKRQSDETIFK